VPIALWSVLGGLALVMFVAMLTITLGAVHGTEFCPQTFERRSYSCYELPLVGVQVTAMRREDLSTVAESFLTSNKYIPPLPKGGRQDWHIIFGSRGTKLYRRGDASILMQYLDAQDAKTMHRWVKWSEDHPQLAKVFWPAVQTLSIHELYVFVPELFELTKQHNDPAALQGALNKEVIARLLFLARRLQAAGDHAAALAVLGDALAIDPANQELQRAQNTSRAAVQPAPATAGKK
jgi:hypothetical protein